MKNIETFVSWAIVVAFVALAAVGVVSLFPGQKTFSGSIDEPTAVSVRYTTKLVTSTPVMLLDYNSARLGLRIENQGATSTFQVYLYSTSTGVIATSGIAVAAGGNYTPDFKWYGQVWLSPTGTSTAVAQEPLPN